MNANEIKANLNRLYFIAPAFNLNHVSDRFEKDARRFRAFLEAIQIRTSQFVQTIVDLTLNGNYAAAQDEITQARIFGHNARELAMGYFAKLNELSKFQFPKDLFSGKYKDPFAPNRQAVRSFAQVWQLDEKFVEMMG